MLAPRPVSPCNLRLYLHVLYRLLYLLMPISSLNLSVKRSEIAVGGGGLRVLRCERVQSKEDGGALPGTAAQAPPP
ncbi:hypothetical protein PR003_g3185 [Phytophthora rubi]|uniref:RxLR effector protein n=1 Tax=Phytophthora rubi TaxID=129364 RepID=A0A6A4FQQ5_9STRA|nr:hypothetical protein PR003_g3185 [Phytophthora rubi]